MTRSAEFDAFGPWVDRVHDATEVPGLYRDYPVDFVTSRLVLKVPRNISRRDALPTMDLYDHLIIAAPETLVVLSRANADTSGSPRGYTERTLGYGDVAAVTETIDMVDGRLDILARTGETLTVPYNGSSQQVITRLIDVLSELTLAALRPTPAVTIPEADAPPADLDLLDLGKEDVGLVTSYFDVMRHELGAILLAAHGRMVLPPRGGLVNRAVHAFYPMTLHGAVLCRTDRELHIVGRKGWLVRGSTPDLSRSHTSIPLAAIDEIVLAPHPTYLGASVVTVRLGAARIDLVLPEGSAAVQALVG
ncbi:MULTISPECIES: hypothetical protein [Cryobacterium]|uniref:hypothetical protein n=1 Tax=Cryobacterium TaxID=69578 RepID=UPI000CD3B2ED|nr:MULTISPECIES: hypothetical protein [Cryobacterium]POH63723.1 hypothetical protein C3B60_16590 [Cryobacterium zongtaii]TFC40856.1 hypothetical protein E3O57_18200 [Cryobacterium sp. TMN-39-2]